MKINWSQEARRQFLSSIETNDIILTRFISEHRFFLIPETLLQWIEDLAIFTFSEIPQHNILITCKRLGISLSPEETELLRNMEKATRKEEAYREFVQELASSEHLQSLLSPLIQKIASQSRHLGEKLKGML